jgi:dolichol-phosphate mannosyltransferase
MPKATNGREPVNRALVIIPTYNEAVNLPQIVPVVLAQDPRVEVLVVDDNSPDGTGRLADEMAASNPRVHVLHRPAKEGLGRAYLAGFEWALTHDFQAVFEMDADFSHDPTFIPHFLIALNEARGRPGPRLALRYRGERHQLAHLPAAALPGREFLRPGRHRPAAQ